MYGKKVKLRILFLSLVISFFNNFIVFNFKIFEENVVYFLVTFRNKNLTEINSKKIRIGGMVKDQSITN